MKNTIRCCISCILPCGVLDVIRIVHANGRVDEITGTIRASDILKAYPKHVLKKPTTRPCYDDNTAVSCRPAIVIVPPDSQLQRGKFYFLIPAAVSPAAAPAAAASSKKKKSSSTPSSASAAAAGRRRRREKSGGGGGCGGGGNNNVAVLDSDQYLSEILSEKMTSSTQRERRRGRVAVWRPHLESISETTLSETASAIG